MNENKISFSDNFFNIKLYLQAMKSLKIPGIVGLICLLLLSIFTIISNNMYDYGTIFLQAESEVYSIQIIILFILVPLMTLILFHYLTTRNGSDFYHSVATKRRSVYFSFVSAVISWALIIIVCFNLVTTAAYLMISDKTYILNGYNIFSYSFNIFISCILVAAVFAFGCSITGTLFSNITAAVCILVVPRLIVTVMAYMVSDLNIMVSMSDMPLLTEYTCNIPFCLLVNIAYYGFDSPTLSIGFPTLYTFIIAIIYILLGCIAYTKRPSETAGKAAASNKIQYCLRMLIGYVISLLIVCMICMESDVDDLIFSCITVFVVAVLIMFLYELITARSLKSAYKAILHSPLLLVMDAITIGIIIFATDYTLNNVPESSEVESVSVNIYDSYTIEQLIYDSSNAVSTNNMIYSDYYYYDYYGTYDYYCDSYTNYILERLSDIEITDEKIIETAVNALNRYSSLIVDNTDSILDIYRYYEKYDSTAFLPYEFSITYDTGLSEITRYVRLSTSDAQTIINAILSSEEADDILTSLPDYGSNGAYVLCPELTDAEIRDVYNTFLDDLKDMSLIDYLKSIGTSPQLCTLNLYNYDNGALSSTTLYLTPATPNAFALYMNYYNEHNENNFYNNLSTVISAPDSYSLYATALIMDYSDNAEDAFYYGSYDYAPSDTANSLNILNEITNLEVTKIPDDFENNFNSDEYYLCYIHLRLHELYSDESYAEYGEDYTYERFINSSGCFILVPKSSGIKDLFDIILFN